MSLSLSRARKLLVTVASAGLLATITAVGPGASAAAPDRDTTPHWFGVRPTDVGAYTTNGVPDQAAKPGGGGGGGSTSNGILYHGGPLMLGTPTAYYIWYGNWGTNTAKTILTDLAQNIGGSPYFHINTTYVDGTNTPVSGLVHYGGAVDDPGTGDAQPLSDAQIGQIVARNIGSGAGKLPPSTNAVYFVLTAGDVQKSGFGTSYCGWHTHGTISNSDIKYSFVGNPDPSYPTSCAVQTTGPNGNWGADAMASVIAHELEEAVTDPDLNAWYDRRGYENADKCAWTFGTTYTTSNGAKANMTIGTRDFLIQRNWVNANGGLCALSF